MRPASSARRSPIRLKHSVGPNGRSFQVGVTPVVRSRTMLLWDARVAREAAREARTEAAFDQADAHAREGNLELALEWLAEAEDLAGGLPDAYIAQREQWISTLVRLAVVVRR